MTRIRRALTVLTLSAASVTAGWFGYSKYQNVAFAAEQKQVEATREQLSKADDLATVFRSVGKVVEPSVVNINVRKTIKGVHHLPMDPDMLRRFFPKDENGQPQIPDDLQGGDEDMEQIGTGSGVIMDVDGSTAYVLTNNHVAGGAEEMLITLSDGREISKAKLVGADPKSDLAVVKFEADRIIPAKWGNSDDLQKGDWIMAFGSPFGYVGSMTHGIISALNRTNVGILGNQGYENFIQVDAPINPGNSGGPLVNLHGEVIGIARDIVASSLQMQDCGAAAILLEAVPPEIAKAVVDQTSLPIIGCGAGPACHACVIVTQDGLGLTPHRPRFVPTLTELAAPLKDAFAAYVQAVRTGAYPAPEHDYVMPPAEKAAFVKQLQEQEDPFQDPPF